MSILLAYKKDGKVFMATDTVVVSSNNMMYETAEDDLKIRKSPSGILVGVTGDRILRQNVFTFMDCFTTDENGDLTKKHISLKIVPKLFSGLSDLDSIRRREDDSTPYMNTSILLAYKDKLFEICNDFAVYRYEKSQALGKAADFAAYALANVDANRDMKEQFEKILALVAKHGRNVAPPFVMINTEEEEYEFIGGEKC